MSKLEIASKLKQRFAKDCGIPISIFVEPYFTERLELYDQKYGTLSKYARFIDSLNGYRNEQDYLTDYNKFKDTVIMDIKNSDGYQRFNNDDFNKYAVDNKGITNKHVFKNSNIGKTIMSIDMVKANFGAMRHYDSSIFNECKSYEEYIRQFTDNEHFINSKYIRQVIFGNSNPRRQTTYEKYLMGTILNELVSMPEIADNIMCFTNDEILIDISKVSDQIITMIKDIVNNSEIELTIEEYTLNGLSDGVGYVKEFATGGYEFKCVDGLYIPMLLRQFNNEIPNDSDLVFMHNGALAKLIEHPIITKTI